MNLIAAADKHWGIGAGNQLLTSIPDDMRYFREVTAGKIVVMGRRTRESIPGGRLKGRVNIVLTHQTNEQADGILFVSSMEDLFRVLEPYDTDAVFVIGGASIYGQMLDACHTAYITKIDAAYAADAYMPDLDAHPQWELSVCKQRKVYLGTGYRFCIYKRIIQLPCPERKI
ncbi:MAG: dihydrofolate reductase [Eubacterium sp.]|nr:dihydrofolate reductase [Eubacterium sp.]